MTRAQAKQYLEQAGTRGAKTAWCRLSQRYCLDVTPCPDSRGKCLFWQAVFPVFDGNQRNTMRMFAGRFA